MNTHELCSIAIEIAEEAALCALESESIGPADQNFYLDDGTMFRMKREIDFLLAIRSIKETGTIGVYQRV
jgi:hypothetical protein